MEDILGLSYTSIWWAFLYLVIFCVATMPIERAAEKAARQVTKKRMEFRIVYFLLQTAANIVVLFLLDMLMSNVTLLLKTLLALAAFMAFLVSFSAD